MIIRSNFFILLQIFLLNTAGRTEIPLKLALNTNQSIKSADRLLFFVHISGQDIFLLNRIGDINYKKNHNPPKIQMARHSVCRF
jgi:hypothetical protein